MTIDAQRIKTDIISLQQDLIEHSSITQKTINLAKSLFLALNDQQIMQNLLESTELEECQLVQMGNILCERALEGTAWSSFFHTLSAIYNYITSGFDDKSYVSNTDQLLSIITNPNNIVHLLMSMRYKACIAIMHEITGDNRSSSFVNVLQQYLGVSPLMIATRQVAKIKEALHEMPLNGDKMLLEVEDMLKYMQGMPISEDGSLARTFVALIEQYGSQDGGINDIVDGICDDCDAVIENTVFVEESNIEDDTYSDCDSVVEDDVSIEESAIDERGVSDEVKIAAWWVEMQYRVVCAVLFQKNNMESVDLVARRVPYPTQECNWKDGCASTNSLVRVFAIASNIVHTVLRIDEPLPYFEHRSDTD